MHPNAIMVYDLRSTTDGILYMALEYVDGPTLGQVLEAGRRFTPAEAVAILEQVASVLDAAHAAGVVHRDVKPDNVMIGITARAPSRSSSAISGSRSSWRSTPVLTGGLPIGTPVYMSPEQWGAPARDGLHEIDGRADVYSLAVMTYEMVTGVRPFPGPRSHEYRQQHLSMMPPPAAERVAGIPVGFSEVVAHGWQRTAPTARSRPDSSSRRCRRPSAPRRRERSSRARFSTLHRRRRRPVRRGAPRQTPRWLRRPEDPGERHGPDGDSAGCRAWRARDGRGTAVTHAGKAVPARSATGRGVDRCVHRPIFLSRGRRGRQACAHSPRRADEAPGSISVGACRSRWSRCLPGASRWGRAPEKMTRSRYTEPRSPRFSMENTR